MKKIVVAGVPEAFSQPVIDTIEHLKNQGYDIQFIVAGKGTNQMMAWLKDGTADIALPLTEGCVKALTSQTMEGTNTAEQGGSEIISQLTTTPLRWGVHVKPNSELDSVEDLQERLRDSPESVTYIVSGPNSGSANISRASTKEWGIPQETLNMRVVGKIDQLQASMRVVPEGQEEVLLWNHQTTHHLTTNSGNENADFKRIGDYEPEWLAFVVAARKDLTQEHPEFVKLFLETLAQKNQELTKERATSKEFVDKWFGGDEQEAISWYETTTFSNQNYTAEELQKDFEKIVAAGIITPEKASGVQVERILGNLDKSIAAKRQKAFSTAANAGNRQQSTAVAAANTPLFRARQAAAKQTAPKVGR